MQYKYAVNPRSGTTPYAGLLNNGQIYYQLTSSSAWVAAQAEPANLVDVVIANNQICALDGAGFIYYYVQNAPPAPPQWIKDTIASEGVALSSDDFGNLFCTNKSGEAWVRSLVWPPFPAWNKITINLAPPATRNYTVKQGDWLLLIVRREYNTWGNDAQTIAIAEQIKVLNPTHGNWDILKVGEVLAIPA